jgi:hypothetical protein
VHEHTLVLNVAIFWDIAPCGPYVKRIFGGTYQLHLQGRKSAEQRVSDGKPIVHAPSNVYE